MLVVAAYTPNLDRAIRPARSNALVRVLAESKMTAISAHVRWECAVVADAMDKAWFSCRGHMI